ncbi:4'-phosphopantetheinyl transferase superfamily protein [Streptomyces sp. NRRL S-87]|uniref:4'-phosphopantetheinyl transferase family protein n=1 Tax=Streptomyces sp. NRRL S-87 TaxID=1463920 RepID=UPI000ACA4128|nr:4'-phosphopantetheinyl transferase superfamily protein [Streptomyces sp. NRRL S-87]
MIDEYGPRIDAYELGGDAVPAVRWPAAAEVALWRLDTTRTRVGGRPVGDALLDAAERDRAARFVRPADRERYRAAHVGLRVLLGAYLGLAPEAVPLVREACPVCGGPHGRPAIGSVVGGDASAGGGGVAGAGSAGDVAGGSAGDAGLHFSLSHSGDTALVAVARVPVGVDVEELPDAAVLADLLLALHPLEAAELGALPEADRPAAVARLWCRKEAYLKGTGTGLSEGLADPYIGTGPGPVRLPGWTVRTTTAPPGYAAAVALADPTGP